MNFRFLHCSDIHLLSLDGVRLRSFLNKRVPGAVNLILRRKRGHDRALFDQIVEHARRESVDRLVITGDVTNLALESEFVLVKEKLDGAGLPVTVIPGNHDIYTRGSARVLRFETFMSQHMRGELIDNHRYPFVQRFGRLSFIGVNTAVPTLPMSAIGKIGASQLRRVASALASEGRSGQVRVVLMHHPPGPHASKRGHELLDLQAFNAVVAEQGAELVLHGHEHVQLDYKLDGPDGEVPVHGVASGTSRSQRPGREAMFSIYSFDGQTLSREIWRLGADDRFAPIRN